MPSQRSPPTGGDSEKVEILVDQMNPATSLGVSDFSVEHFKGLSCC